MKSLPILYFFLWFCLSAQAQFNLSGQIRPRGEFSNGTNSSLALKNNVPGFAIQQRTRIQLLYENEKMKFHFSPQYISFWGQQAETNTSGSISIYEAWAGYKFAEKFTIQFGRQPLSYGDQRFFGALDWAASGRAHDAFIVKFKDDNLSLDAGFTFNQVGYNNDISQNKNTGESSNKSIQYLWLDAGGEKFKYSAMLANVITETKPVIYYSYTTLGLLPELTLSESLSIKASAYLQTGKFNGTKIRGYLFALEVAYKAGSIPLTVGADIISGDDENTQDKNETWMQQFGTNHKFYGFMDFFYVGEQPSMGLNDFYIKSAFATGERSKILTHFHYFIANKKFTDEVSGTGIIADGYLGSEIDLIYSLNLSKELNIKLGYSQLFASDSFELYKSGYSSRINNWAWLQLTLNTQFFEK